jgi:hypothetical protein
MEIRLWVHGNGRVGDILSMERGSDEDIGFKAAYYVAHPLLASGKTESVQGGSGLIRHTVQTKGVRSWIKLQEKAN